MKLGIGNGIFPTDLISTASSKGIIIIQIILLVAIRDAHGISPRPPKNMFLFTSRAAVPQFFLFQPHQLLQNLMQRLQWFCKNFISPSPALQIYSLAIRVSWTYNNAGRVPKCLHCFKAWCLCTWKMETL